jgi:hypothetical protein
MVEFNLNGWEQINELFGSEGCDNAGEDGKHAATYIRAFVAARTMA